MQPLEVLYLVRQGYAAASTAQAGIVAALPEVAVIAGNWVPRWALEVEVALEEAGLSPEERRVVYGQGREAVIGFLEGLVKAGKRRQVLEERNRFARPPFDLRTEAALVSALWQHRSACRACRALRPCLAAARLEEEIDELFPRDRRKRLRGAIPARARQGRI